MQKLKLTRKIIIIQKIRKQRNIQKTYKSTQKEADWKKENYRVL